MRSAPGTHEFGRVEFETDNGSHLGGRRAGAGSAPADACGWDRCEATLDGHLTFMKNQDVPGVIGYIGTVMGKHGVNIANFSLGRRDHPTRPGEPLEAVAVIEADCTVPDYVLQELLTNPALKLARSVEFGALAGAAGR